MKLVSMIAAAVAVLALSGLDAVRILPPAMAQQTAARPAQQEQVFAIDNMTCAGCPITVSAAMKRVEGVISVDIDFAARTATVLFDPSLTTPDAIAEASTNVGYPAHRVEG